MDGGNADSDHSMTWEDFFGSTTDLTPTLIGIYDSLLEPAKCIRPEVNRLEKAKDARNDPPVVDKQIQESTMTENAIDNVSSVKISNSPTKDPSKMVGTVKLPIATINKSSLYSIRTVSDKNGANEEINKPEVSTSHITAITTSSETIKTSRDIKQVSETNTFDNLSPNVKRMISSATGTPPLKFQKKSFGVGRSSSRYKTNIPLVGATSKISQSGLEILPSVEIYDQPCGLKTFGKPKSESNNELPSKQATIKPEIVVSDTQATYDVPTNNRPAIYDVPNANNKTAFESLSLPYIDQSIELSISSNDREFDTKLSPKSPQKPKIQTAIEESPAKIQTSGNNGTNSLHRKDFVNKSENSVKQLAKAGPYPEVIGSTGNLKTCAVSEKEVSRLNPPSLEVSRPLSMSSIASSSSTSSSGVQNKGGVNSAYLASIESLDDHSDADITSANGSNNFVNSAGILNAGGCEERRLDHIPRLQESDEMPGLSPLERVCAEIVQTENVYVEDLRQVVDGYLQEWRRESAFSVDELSELFNNIENIYTFNKSLCEELNSCRLDATCIARCFVNNTAGFAVYTSYCTGYPRTMERLAALASKPHSAREFRERQLALGHPLPLASYLLKPVQRILKYHLLLQNVVKQCATNETEYALLKMTGIAHHIDEMKRRHEHAVRVQEIQSLLYGWSGPDLTTYGELCAEGTFRVFGAKAMRHAFLFDKMLLITKNREDGILAYKSHIMCNNMMLVESIAGAPLSFHVIPWDEPRAQLTLQARSPRHKREWTLLLKRVILENYNAVIPSHARQIVMELGQNKTDDDILAEKSHNLITQASMRKQLSAPEYLEKRKLERERRKSLENGTRGRLKKINRKLAESNSRSEVTQECDCAQVSIEKGTDYTCDTCYVDLCSDCETELSNQEKGKEKKCVCMNVENSDLTGEKCSECDRSLQYIDAGSVEHLERKQTDCKCSDFKSSQESFTKERNGSLNKSRGYHSSDNIISYTNSKEDLSDTNNSLINVRSVPNTCLKCVKIKENIAVTESQNNLHVRKSRCNDFEKQKNDSLRSKSKEDPQRSKLSKIGTWRRKSEPGLQPNTAGVLSKKFQDSDNERIDIRGSEKIEFECRNCGSNKITRKLKTIDGLMISDSEMDSKKRGGNNSLKANIEIKMYNTKHIPKKITKLKKSRAKGLRLVSDTTAKFYADFSTDVSTENILHISESNDSLNVDKIKRDPPIYSVPETITKDEDIDEETYKKLIEKTDSFKKNELEKVKFLNKQKVINEGSEAEDKQDEIEIKPEDIPNKDQPEQPLEQIISQLLMQNREFQKLLKKQQLRNCAQRRHQRLLKSYSSPEQVIVSKNNELSKIKPKYSRQTSENLNFNDDIETVENEVEIVSDEDHIYETLRIEDRVDENLHSLNAKSKSIHHNTHVSRPIRIPSPPSTIQKLPQKTRGVHESEYVYLSFNELSQLKETDIIYDVPTKFPEKVDEVSKVTDYYVTMENKGLRNGSDEENLYDNLVEVCRRKKEVPSTLPGEYLAMSPDQQSPNTPEIWLSRQKEHFNVSRDRKSGSLPRSFQVLTSNHEDNNLSTFKCKPNSNSKTYLNRDGKVVSLDRPFTIASDQSEISYDDVENYMSEADVLKFHKKTKEDYVQDISRSTLELEEEIDRCYKNNFEKVDLDANKTENLLTASQPNLNTSATSSCEIIHSERNDNSSKDVEIIHPEHKIYKPTTSLLSLKNVLSRFKNRIPNKNSDEIEINANDQSSPDSTKSEAKSPTSEKRAALNPRNYSKTLLQRFRSILSDEHSDDNQNKSEYLVINKQSEDTHNSSLSNEIKVVITSTNSSPTTSTIFYTVSNEALSKSVCEASSLTESRTNKTNFETISHSCDNINDKHEIIRPSYEKSVSLVTNMTSSANSISSSTKSNNTSHKSLNKLPIYMQGSKHLGARIAQSDYVDPTTLASERSALKNINVLINKNAVRPDSLFSNSSFGTSSSEGTYQDGQFKSNLSQSANDSSITIDKPKDKSSDSSAQINSDESFYEKSFEKIEHVVDEDIFRDSAVYSDQEDSEEPKVNLCEKNMILHKEIGAKESLITDSTFKAHRAVVVSESNDKTGCTSHTICVKNVESQEKPVNKALKQSSASSEKSIKTKVAPPVPIKPRISNNSNVVSYSSRTSYAINRNVEKQEKQIVKTSESIDIGSSSKQIEVRQILLRSESSPIAAAESEIEISVKTNESVKNIEKCNAKIVDQIKPVSESNTSSNIQLKRLSFERASLDSATRKIQSANDSKMSLKTSTKSVLERRMEIEMMSKTQVTKTSQTAKKTTLPVRPKSITNKVATFERNINEIDYETKKYTSTVSVEKTVIPSNKNNVNETDKPESSVENDPKESWVKQIVNKFQ